MIHRKKLPEQVAEGIREYIVGNSLKPGDRLPTEHQLADQFGVSRISVREATKALGFLGIVEAAPRRGLTVGTVDMQRVSEFLGFHLALADHPLEQLVETRVVIETGGLPHLMRRLSEDPAIYERLNSLNEQLRNTRSLKKWIELDIQFHRALLDESGLKPLLAFAGLLEIFFHRVRESVQKGEWDVGIESHQRIIDGLRDGRLQEACDELRSHIESHLDRINDLDTVPVQTDETI